MPELPATWPKNAPSSFHILGKPSGATCNYDYTYCFFLSLLKAMASQLVENAGDAAPFYTHVQRSLSNGNLPDQVSCSQPKLSIRRPGGFRQHAQKFARAIRAKSYWLRMLTKACQLSSRSALSGTPALNNCSQAASYSARDT